MFWIFVYLDTHHRIRVRKKKLNRLLTEIGNRTGGFLVMALALVGGPRSGRRRWRRWSHAGSRADYDCGGWRRRWTAVSSVISAYLGLRWHQHCFAPRVPLRRAGAPAMQHPYGAAYFRLQFGGPISSRVSHLRYGEPALSRVTRESRER